MFERRFDVDERIEAHIDPAPREAERIEQRDDQPGVGRAVENGRALPRTQPIARNLDITAGVYRFERFMAQFRKVASALKSRRTRNGASG